MAQWTDDSHLTTVFSSSSKYLADLASHLAVLDTRLTHLEKLRAQKPKAMATCGDTFSPGLKDSKHLPDAIDGFSVATTRHSRSRKSSNYASTLKRATGHPDAEVSSDTGLGELIMQPAERLSEYHRYVKTLRKCTADGSKEHVALMGLEKLLSAYLDSAEHQRTVLANCSRS